MIDTLIIVLLAIFATYRLARLISTDTILDPLREAINRKASKPNSPWYWIAEWVNCAHCVGMWIAFIMVIIIALVMYWSLLMGILILLAVAGGQSFLWSLVERNYEEE